MTHVRASIRSAIVSALTGLTTTGARVFNSRAYPVTEAELPCLVIGTGDEVVEPENMGWRPALKREMAIEVAAVAQAVAGVETTLDAIAEEVEIALWSSQTQALLNGLLLQPIRLDGIEIEIGAQGQKPVGRLVMRLTAVYETDAGVPGTAL